LNGWVHGRADRPLKQTKPGRPTLLSPANESAVQVWLARSAQLGLAPTTDFLKSRLRKVEAGKNKPAAAAKKSSRKQRIGSEEAAAEKAARGDTCAVTRAAAPAACERPASARPQRASAAKCAENMALWTANAKATQPAGKDGALPFPRASRAARARHCAVPRSAAPRVNISPSRAPAAQ